MLNWTKTNDYIQAETKNFKFNDKLAMFDLDSTLIEPKIGTKGNGKGFPIDENDWIWKYIFIKEFLTELLKKKYSIIIISNQNGISKGKQSFESFTNKINQICKELNLETYIFCSINDNKYRKPRPAWFYEILPDIIFNKIDRKLSFYCGDAAGRTGDFSDCDYKFALNCLLYFHTPESLFLNQHNNNKFIKYPQITKKIININFTPKKNDIIVMVGAPGSGKSYMAKYIENKFGYTIINQDILKSKGKCIKVATQCIKNNLSFIIDSTNPSIDNRIKWITLAQNNKYNICVIEMITPIEISIHNNYYRNYISNINIVPNIVYNIYKSKYTKPSIEEGFYDIIHYDFGTPNDPKYYFYYY